ADAALGWKAQGNRPEPDRIAALADRIVAMVRLQRTPRTERRLAILIPNYPNAPGRTGYAVGLDVPQSVLEMLRDLKEAGYRIEGIPESARELLRLLDLNRSVMPFEDYRDTFGQLPRVTREKVVATWGEGVAAGPISPPVGEMPGRAEGCAGPPTPQPNTNEKTPPVGSPTLPPSG